MKTLISFQPSRVWIMAAALSVPLLLGAVDKSESLTRTPVKTELQTVALELGKAIDVHVDSPGVAWKGYEYHLVKIGSARFNLDQPTGHLTAELKAGITTFDNVDYDVSVAVFGPKGELLGVARTPCQVQRLWLGRVVFQQQTLNFDFGISLDYQRATSFGVSISKRAVLTPDQWQK